MSSCRQETLNFCSVVVFLKVANHLLYNYAFFSDKQHATRRNYLDSLLVMRYNFNFSLRRSPKLTRKCEIKIQNWILQERLRQTTPHEIKVPIISARMNGRHAVGLKKYWNMQSWRVDHSHPVKQISLESYLQPLKRGDSSIPSFFLRKA